MALKRFLDSYQQVMPKTHKNWLTSLSKPPKLFVYHPITAHTASLGLTIKSQHAIPAHANVLMLSTSESFTSKELIGASIRQSNDIRSAFSSAKQQYEMLESEEIQNLFSILMQVYANEVQLDYGAMPLHSFANALMMEDMNTPSVKALEKKIQSPHLLNILKANSGMVQKLYEILQNFVKTSNPAEFGRVLSVVRARMRRIHFGDPADANFIDFIAPIFYSLQQSYTPNCTIIGKYFTHLRQSYYCLQTLRPIREGEQLTLSHRADTNNYDKFVRYGPSSISETNPYNNYMLIINSEAEPEIFSGDIEEKSKELKENKLKMKNIIKIGTQGNVVKEDLRMLRILFGGQKDHEGNDGRIMQMLKKYVQSNLRLLQSAGKERKGEEGKEGEEGEERMDEVVRAIRIVEREEIAILNKFLDLNK